MQKLLKSSRKIMFIPNYIISNYKCCTHTSFGESWRRNEIIDVNFLTNIVIFRNKTATMYRNCNVYVKLCKYRILKLYRYFTQWKLRQIWNYWCQNFLHKSCYFLNKAVKTYQTVFLLCKLCELHCWVE